MTPSSERRDVMRDRFVLTALAVVLLLLPGCGSRVSRIQSESTILDPALGLTVLPVHTPGPAWIEDIVEDAAGCVTSAVAKVPKARLVKTEEFRRYVFPDQTDEVALTRELFRALGKDAEFQRRATAARIRYIVGVGGTTKQPSPRSTCTSGGCLFVWERESTAWAEVVDVTGGDSVAIINAAVSGRPFLLLSYIPMGAPSFTETWACHKLKRGLVEFLTARGGHRP
jgi:hypothetical protein